MESKSPFPKIKAIRFEGLHLNYENRNPILKNVDFEFPPNEIVWIRSSEGAGKSSLLQLLAGLTMPTLGRYYLNEDEVGEMSFEDFLPYRLAIGYSFDYGGLISNRTLLDNMMLPLVYHKVLDPAAAKERITKICEPFGIEKYLQERPAHVSGRIRKIVCLLRAIVTWPQMLLLDDPSVGIGMEAQESLFEIIVNLRHAGHLQHVFISSYDEKFVRMFNPVTIYLEEGQLYRDRIESEEGQKKIAHF